MGTGPAITHEPTYPPASRDPLQLPAPLFLELKARTDDQVADRSRDEDLRRARKRANPGPDVHGESAEVIAEHLTLTAVYARAYLNAELIGVCGDLTSAADGERPAARTNVGIETPAPGKTATCLGNETFRGGSSAILENVDVSERDRATCRGWNAQSY